MHRPRTAEDRELQQFTHLLCSLQQTSRRLLGQVDTHVLMHVYPPLAYTSALWNCIITHSQFWFGIGT